MIKDGKKARFGDQDSVRITVFCNIPPEYRAPEIPYNEALDTLATAFTKEMNSGEA